MSSDQDRTPSWLAEPRPRAELLAELAAWLDRDRLELEIPRTARERQHREDSDA